MHTFLGDKVWEIPGTQVFLGGAFSSSDSSSILRLLLIDCLLVVEPMSCDKTEESGDFFLGEDSFLTVFVVLFFGVKPIKSSSMSYEALLTGTWAPSDECLLLGEDNGSILGDGFLWIIEELFWDLSKAFVGSSFSDSSCWVISGLVLIIQDLFLDTTELLGNCKVTTVDCSEDVSRLETCCFFGWCSFFLEAVRDGKKRTSNSYFNYL